MANLRDIRRRIKSVTNTAQITRAMQLVAASKMKKAQDQALAQGDWNLSQMHGLGPFQFSGGEIDWEIHYGVQTGRGNKSVHVISSSIRTWPVTDRLKLMLVDAGMAEVESALQLLTSTQE